jgi:hypothetical protein
LTTHSSKLLRSGSATVVAVVVAADVDVEAIKVVVVVKHLALLTSPHSLMR